MKRRPVLFLIATQVLDCQRPVNLEAIKVHDLDPGVDEVAGKFLTGVISGVDFCDRPAALSSIRKQDQRALRSI